MATRPRSYEDFQPPSNLVQEEDCETLIVDLPGFRKEQIRVQAQDRSGTLLISGERPIGNNKWGRFRKDLRVPINCNINEVQAKFENGVLRIIMPLKVVPKTAPPSTVQTQKVPDTKKPIPTPPPLPPPPPSQKPLTETKPTPKPQSPPREKPVTGPKPLPGPLSPPSQKPITEPNPLPSSLSPPSQEPTAEPAKELKAQVKENASHVVEDCKGGSKRLALKMDESRQYIVNMVAAVLVVVALWFYTKYTVKSI